MMIRNPFSDFGNIVSGNRFIGRKTEISQIHNRLLGENYGNLAIMGLPRVGKSSLAWKALMEIHDSLLRNKIILIRVPLGELIDLREFLDETLMLTCEDINRNFGELNPEMQELFHMFSQAQTGIEQRRFAKRFFRRLKSIGLKLIVIIDEFDSAAEIFGLHDFQYLREISYNIDTKIGIVTVSRKTIQELEPDNGSLSNFYQIFDELRLKPFSPEDMLFYWERIRSLGITVTDNFIKEVLYYTGRHPFLLDLLNCHIFNHITQTDIDLDKVFETTLDELKLKLYNEYESMFRLMGQEGLDNKLLQLIIGPVYDISKSDVERLLKYNLVGLSPEDKIECFAPYFEEYLSLKAVEADIWPLWRELEQEIRQIITMRQIEKYGDDWEGGFDREYGVRRQVLLDNLRMLREKNKKAFGEKASDNLIDYTYPMDLFNGFIMSDWKWYSQIFGIKTNSSDWVKKFEHLGKIRNPLAHNNQQFLTETDKVLGTAYCQEILELIKKWKRG